MHIFFQKRKRLGVQGEDLFKILKDVEGHFCGDWHRGIIAQLAKPYINNSVKNNHILAFLLELFICMSRNNRDKVQKVLRPLFVCCNDSKSEGENRRLLTYYFLKLRKMADPDETEEEETGCSNDGLLEERAINE